jgi:kynureninase
MAPSSTEVDEQDKEEFTKQHAKSLDAQDPLRHFRQEFIIPTKADLKRKTLAKPSHEESEDCTYLCGNSLGLQPRRTNDRIQAFLSQWSTKAVTGHFVEHEDSPLAPFLHIDDYAAKLMAPVVGAMESEVAVMGQLTANLLLMMSSFYRPSKEKYKIILEGKAFPSDHVRSARYYAITEISILIIRIILVCD